MKGKLFGIGVGPGGSELLTFKAVSTIQKCGVIAIPDPGSGERTALSIVEKYLEGKELLACRFTMDGERLYDSIEDYEKSPESGYLTVAIVKERAAR